MKVSFEVMKYYEAVKSNFVCIYTFLSLWEYISKIFIEANLVVENTKHQHTQIIRKMYLPTWKNRVC